MPRPDRGIDFRSTQEGEVYVTAAASAEASAGTSEELNSQAEQVNGIVNDLVRLATGRGAARAESPARKKPIGSAGKAAATPKVTATTKTQALISFWDDSGFDEFNKEASVGSASSRKD